MGGKMLYFGRSTVNMRVYGGRESEGVRLSDVPEEKVSVWHIKEIGVFGRAWVVNIYTSKMAEEEMMGEVCISLDRRLGWYTGLGGWSADEEHIVTYKTTEKECKV